MHRAVQKCREGCQIGSNLVQDKKGGLLAGAHNIGWEQKEESLLSALECTFMWD
jgi:hypothetical protein